MGDGDNDDETNCVLTKITVIKIKFLKVKMEPRNQRFKSFQVKRTLDDLIERGVELNKKNILDAETIDYKKVEN